MLTETTTELSRAPRHLGGEVAQSFRRASAAAMRPGRATRQAQKNYLQQLTAERCADLYNALRKGDLADVMIAWDELEEYDDILSTVADKRAAGLAECEASILPESAMIGDNEELRELADKQQAFLVHYLSRIVNMEEAVAHLGSASFRGFAHLYKHVREDGSMQLVAFPQWYFARPAGTSYLLNPTAQVGTFDLYELNPASWICREVKRPIDLVAMFACVVKYNAEQGNASFLEVFGNPSIFFEYPPGTSDERAREYDAVVREMIGDGRGGYPAGGKIVTVESNANSGQSFFDAATWANKKIVRKGLGGELTLLSESGSGTLAGGAHEDGLISLYKADAKSIAAVLHEQLFKPAIQEAFPGAPVLVRYKLDYPQQYDIAVETSAIATLVNAGFKPSAAQVKERTGYDCEEVASAAQQGMNMGTPPAWQGGGMNANRGALLNREPEEGAEDDGSEPPLTDDEWAQFEAAGHIDTGHLERMRSAIEARLKAAAEPYREQNAQNALETPASSLAGTFTKNRQNTPAEPMRSAKNGKNALRGGFFGRVMGYIRHIFGIRNRETGSLLDDFLVTNAAPGTCGAENPAECSVHGVPPQKWKPHTMPDKMSPADARAELTKGTQVKNPLGEDVTLDQRILAHWAREGKSPEDIEKRLAALPLIKQVVANPAEIWENKDGSRTYLASVINPYERGKKYTIAFTQAKNNTTIETYWPEADKVNKKRAGKLLFSEKRPDASGT